MNVGSRHFANNDSPFRYYRRSYHNQSSRRVALLPLHILGKTMNRYPLLNVVLVSPEIPHNTGNIIRLCANVGANLHLVEPIGFVLDDPHLRRASLDYSDLTSVKLHNDVEEIFLLSKSERTFGAISKGSTLYTEPKYERGDTIIFGRESLGLDDKLIEKFLPTNRIRIPMVPRNRSLNLSNAVAVLVYELWRQLGFSESLDGAYQQEQYFS